MDDEQTSRLRVVLAEPFQQLREIVRDILVRGIGVGEVLDAKDGEEALEVIEHFPPDLVIADSSMSPINGIELTRMIRAGEHNINPFTPVLIASGHAEVSQIKAARDVGANDFIAKPVSAKILELRLRAAVEHPRPFVRANSFFGPDRRRHMDEKPKGNERRVEEAEVIDVN